MKAKFRTAKSAFAAAIVVCLSGTSALAVDNFWTGTTSGDWNTATNWSLGRVPANPNGAPTGDNFDDAAINVQTPHVATITANISATPRDIKVGLGDGTSGRVDHIAGNAGTGSGNWMFVAHGGGTGVYNLADTTGTGGVLTGYAQGSGNMTTDRLWVGGVSWWGGGNGIVNINTSGTWNMNDLAIGINNGTGVVNVDAGTLNTAGWNFIGKNDGGGNGTGTLNMSGGTLTNTGRTYMGQADCNGTLNLSGGSYINANDNFFTVGDGAGGVATLNITNSASLLRSIGEFWVGNNQSVGTMTLSAGTVNTNNWTCIARTGGTATVTMSGGTWNKTGGGNFLVGDNSAGVMHQTGGDLTVNGEFWVGENGAGNGTYNFSGGTHTGNYWIAIGRTGGTGFVTMTGGTWTKTGNGNFIVGASGPGTMTQSGGLVDVQGGITWVAEGNNCTGTLTISEDAEFRTSRFVVGVYGGTTGTLNLNGGTVRTGQISGGDGNDTVHFNGSQIIATGHQPAFIGGLNTAAVDAGGLKVDSNGFDLTVSQALSGTGGVVKSGTGALVLDGPNTYAGGNIVANGTLVLTTAATGGGDILVADGATLGVRQTTQASGLSAVNATFGDEGASNLDFDLGNTLGNPVVAPLDVTGTLTLNGAVTVNIADSLPSPGTVFLVSYAGPKDGPGAFVLGDLPEGMSATLNDDGTGLVSLQVSSVSLPIWTGTNGTDWDKDTENWKDGVTNTPTKYTDLAPVLFDDTADDSLVDLEITVEPGKVTFNNSSYAYVLDGSGKITGAGTLTKQGTGALEIWLTGNDFTGVTTLAGGMVTVAKLADGGSPSSLGASSADPANLVLAGATLNYAGGEASTNRGFTINGNDATIRTAADLTISGPVACITGNLTKTGAGKLTLSHPGANVLGTVNPGLRVSGGTLTLSGSGTQTNAVAGELFVGPVPNVPAHLVLDATTLNVQSWIAVGRGNGDTETVSTLTATDSTIVSGNFSSGWDILLCIKFSES